MTSTPARQGTRQQNQNSGENTFRHQWNLDQSIIHPQHQQQPSFEISDLNDFSPPQHSHHPSVHQSLAEASGSLEPAQPRTATATPGPEEPRRSTRTKTKPDALNYDKLGGRN